MKQKEKKSRASILSVVAAQVKGKDLFPKKTDAARKLLSKARLAK